MDRILQGILPALMLAIASGTTLWMAGAIYYDVCRGTQWGRVLALAWAVGVVALFVVWQPLWQPFVVLMGIATLFIGWWLRQKPSHDREWEPSVAVLPRAVRDGDAVTIENVRNLDYRSGKDFTPRHEARTFHLANLRGADILFFNWGSPWMSHPVLDFDFGSDGHVCVSAEVRYRKGQKFSILRSLYRQQELIFVVADERDVILSRTKYGLPQESHLYRFNASVEELRTAFLDYVEAINDLYQRPRWYHALCANCTTTFYRMPHSHCRFDWRVLANGRLDQALYEAGRLDQSLPFPELRRTAYLTDVANSAPEAGFGDHIRRELERRRHER
jgi:hypothetical protein